MRQRIQESLGETSGAVEIGVEQLDRFERGSEVPSEDILLLLISHFNLQDDEAIRVWEMAGYDSNSRPFADDYRDDPEDAPSNNNQFGNRHPVQVMLLALDNRVLYTNGAEIVTDDNGVVLNFTQSDGSSGANAVSRVGMSYPQAEQLLQTLQRALLHKKYLSGPKQLPPPQA
jgi:hypothetical protein